MRNQGIAISLLIAACSNSDLPGNQDAPQAVHTRSASQWVNPFVGTDSTLEDEGVGGSAGATYPGATMPFGMLQWSPDTSPNEISFAGGYTYRDKLIRGFSLTHFSGAGCSIFRDLPIIPFAGRIARSPAIESSSDLQPEFYAQFNHTFERASPGYYQVRLNPESAQPINVELAASTRAGIGRLYFAPGSTANVLINAGGSAQANSHAAVSVDPARREISGQATSGRMCFQDHEYTVYFVVRFEQAFDDFGTWTGETLQPGSVAASDTGELPLNYSPIPGGPGSLPGNPSGTAQAGAYASFDTDHAAPIILRVGLSYVSVDNARHNLDAEVATQDFDSLRHQADETWDRTLGAIEIEGGSPRDRRTFYTNLYQALLQPNTYSDANGAYRGADGQIHQAGGRTHYTNFSGWDIYRTQIPLISMLQPQRAGDMAQSLIEHYRQSGYLPKYPVGGQHTNIMVGDAAALILADVDAYGVDNFDRQAALMAMDTGASVPGRADDGRYVQRAGLETYLQLGYVPLELNIGAGNEQFGHFSGGFAMVIDPALVWGSAATTLEYVLADFAIARMAARAGDQTLCQRYAPRSANWRTLFNPASGAIEARFASGLFDPLADPTSVTGWVEGSQAQYGWFVSHDLAGLIDALGGSGAASARLDEFFTEFNAGPVSAYAALGNEPSFQTPWIYNWLGQAHQAQRISRQALLALYSDEAVDGKPGNDDGGTMAAWAVFNALGLFPMIPGTDVLAIGAPLFPAATLHLPDGPVRIGATGAARDRPYVESLRMNGSPHPAAWLRFADLRAGGSLDFRMSDQASSGFGARPSDAPPSFAPSTLCQVEP